MITKNKARRILKAQAPAHKLTKAAEVLCWMTQMTDAARTHTQAGHDWLDEGHWSNAAHSIRKAHDYAQAATKAHDELWDLVGEALTGQAWEAFCEAETLHGPIAALAVRHEANR